MTFMGLQLTMDYLPSITGKLTRLIPNDTAFVQYFTTHLNGATVYHIQHI
jgi:hypothetical protein